MQFVTSCYRNGEYAFAGDITIWSNQPEWKFRLYKDPLSTNIWEGTFDELVAVLVAASPVNKQTASRLNVMAQVNFEEELCPETQKIPKS